MAFDALKSLHVIDLDVDLEEQQKARHRDRLHISSQVLAPDKSPRLLEQFNRHPGEGTACMKMFK
jgi:hypothetical protein